MNKVSKSIKKFRTAGGLTQAELADKLFVTRQTVSSWENGRTQPDIETLAKLSEALSVSIEELIYGEKPKTVDDGKNEKSRKTMITVFSVIASLLVSVGAVLVFVNYWNSFPHFLKTAFSVMPMLIGQAAAVFVFKKKYDKIPWREGAAVLWCAGVAATVALCDGVLDLSTDFAACAFVDILMFLPIIYIFDAVSPLIVYYGLSIFYGYSLTEKAFYNFNVYNTDIRLNILYVLLAFAMIFVLLAPGALYVYIHRKEIGDGRRAYASWITVIAFAAGVISVSIYCDDKVMIPILSAFMLLYALRDKRTVSAPVNTLMPLGIAVISIFISISFRPGTVITPYERTAKIKLVVLLFSAAAAIAALIIQLKKQKGDVPRNIYSVSVFSLLVSQFIVTLYDEIHLATYIAIFILIMLQAVTLIVAGAKESKFLPLNIGLVTVIALICEILFSSDIDFLIVGFVMIFFGVCLFVINYKLAKSLKKETAEVAGNE